MNKIFLLKSSPTPAQIEAGNYPKRKIPWKGMTISVENEAGSVRQGVDRDGNQWRIRMRFPYGYLNRTEAVDGDHLDCYVGPEPDAPFVYVVHQRKAGDWQSYDEDKAMIGFKSKQEAIRAYLQHYDDERFLGPVSVLPVAEFVEKAKATFDKPAMVKSITLIMPSGNRYELTCDQFSFDDSLLKALEPGQRWITVHPGGNSDSKGVPVLVQETKHGSGVFHVIGGAGGKLNYLKIRGLKPQSTYKEQAAERRKARAEVKKEQAKRDKEAGLTKVKKAAKEDVKNQQKKAEQDFIKTVSSSMGWDEQSLAFDPDSVKGLSEGAAKKRIDQHHKELLDRAHQAVELNRKQLLFDKEAQAEAGSGIPLVGATDAELSANDIDPVKISAGSGFNPDYGGRAEKNGADKETIQAEAEAIKEDKKAVLTDAQKEGIQSRKDASEKIKKELEGLQSPVDGSVKGRLVDAKAAIDLLKAQKALKAMTKRAAAAHKDIDEANEVKAYNIDVEGEPLDDQVMEDLSNDLKTIATKGFLNEAAKAGGEEVLGKHIASGAFNAVNALALAAGGDALVDRSVVDVLGIEGAARALATRLHRDLSAREIKDLTEGMEDYHVHHYMEASKEALRTAHELQDEAREIGDGVSHQGKDLSAAMELNKARHKAIVESQKVLGSTLGEMEANAALVKALKEGPSKRDLEVPLGKIQIEDAIKQARAIGLEPEDYQVSSIGANQILTVKPEALEKLTAPIDRESFKQVDRNLSIIRGDFDEDGWLPKGFADRPELAINTPPGAAKSLAELFRPSDDMEQSLKDYIGGRTADGDAPADILADVQSQDFFEKSGNPAGYQKALDAVVPMRDKDGKVRRAEAMGPEFDRYADEFVKSRYGDSLSPFNKQHFTVDQSTMEALHRTLADYPHGAAAYKPIGELTSQDQKAIRDYFAVHIAKASDHEMDLRDELEKLNANEPEKMIEDMFGEAENPEWSDWKARKDEVAAELNAASLTWPKYVEAMQGNKNAYQSVQDLMRSDISRRFAEAHNTLKPNSPLKVGRSVIAHNLEHLDAIDREAMERRLSERKSFNASIQNRSGGKFASDDVIGKQAEKREEKEAYEQSQMGLFGDMFGEEDTEKKPVPLKDDERHTLGHVAERQLAALMPIAGKNFKPGQPVKMFHASMSGEDGAPRQRAVKLIEANKRLALAAGVGSGKTAIQLGAFAHLHQQGKAKRGLFLVPSTVQGQFGGEALRFLDPKANGGKGWNWHIEPGASRDERIKAYKDPDKHFAVMTHQGFRDDMLHLGAKQAGISEKDMTQKLAKMSPSERQGWAKEVMRKEGINFDYLAIDEGHNLLNRKGKENSSLANVVDSVSANTPYYVNATADPIKNDVSEAFDVLAKMDPERYTDRDAFLRRYQGAGKSQELKREMARYLYPSRIVPKVRADHQVVNVPLSGEQKADLSKLERHVADARLSRLEGKVNVAAAKGISPEAFEGVPEDQHEAVAKNIQDSIGIVKESAIRRILDAHPKSGKLDALSGVAGSRKGKPGVVFAHSLDAVEQIKKRLEAEGHRVVTLTGKDSAKEKDAKRRAFHPDAGDPTADILIASDAGAVGLNLQRGAWLAQYDTSPTAMTHAQRNGRIHRVGQKNDVELIDLVHDHPLERKARERLARKYELRENLTSPLDTLDDTGLAGFLRRRQVAENQASLF